MGAMWEGWFTVGVLVVAFVCLLLDLLQPDHVMVGALALLMVGRGTWGAAMENVVRTRASVAQDRYPESALETRDDPSVNARTLC